MNDGVVATPMETANVITDEDRNPREDGLPNGGAITTARRVRELISEIRKHPGIDDDYDPLLELAKLACDNKGNKQLCYYVNKEVAAYIYPKLRAVEHSGEVQTGPAQVHVHMGISPHQLEEYEAQAVIIEEGDDEDEA